MALAIVKPLEMIDIDHRHGQREALLARACDFKLKLLENSRVISESGQTVDGEQFALRAMAAAPGTDGGQQILIGDRHEKYSILRHLGHLRAAFGKHQHRSHRGPVNLADDSGQFNSRTFGHAILNHDQFHVGLVKQRGNLHRIEQHVHDHSRAPQDAGMTFGGDGIGIDHGDAVRVFDGSIHQPVESIHQFRDADRLDQIIGGARAHRREARRHVGAARHENHRDRAGFHCNRFGDGTGAGKRIIGKHDVHNHGDRLAFLQRRLQQRRPLECFRIKAEQPKLKSEAARQLSVVLDQIDQFFWRRVG